MKTFLLPEVIYQGILLILYTVLIIYNVVAISATWAAGFLGLALSVHFYIVLLAFYEELKENDNVSGNA